jgi:transposase
VGVKNLGVQPLPPSAPDLNPVEWLWKHLKREEMANPTCLDLEDLHELCYRALAGVRGKPPLFSSFFPGADPPL